MSKKQRLMVRSAAEPGGGEMPEVSSTVVDMVVVDFFGIGLNWLICLSVFYRFIYGIGSYFIENMLHGHMDVMRMSNN